MGHSHDPTRFWTLVRSSGSLASNVYSSCPTRSDITSGGGSDEARRESSRQCMTAVRRICERSLHTHKDISAFEFCSCRNLELLDHYRVREGRRRRQRRRARHLGRQAADMDGTLERSRGIGRMARVLKTWYAR
jgi:hypothetical protein